LFGRKGKNSQLAHTGFLWIVKAVSAREVIGLIKHLSPTERVQVVHFVVENEEPVTAGKVAVSVGDDGLPLLRADAGVITSRLVRELESLTP
jgi:hypothetical protein